MLLIEGMSGSEVYDLDVTLQVQLDLLGGSVKDVLLELEQAPRLSSSFVPTCSVLLGFSISFRKLFVNFFLNCQVQRDLANLTHLAHLATLQRADRQDVKIVEVEEADEPDDSQEAGHKG